MFLRTPFYLCVLVWLTLSACQKGTLAGDKDFATLGLSAHDLLSAAPYPELNIEIHYMPGHEPLNASVDSLVNFLELYLKKPGGIKVYQSQIAASNTETLSLTDVVRIEKSTRRYFTANNVLAVHILITDGNYTVPNILATSYWNTSFCIFGKMVDENSGAPGQIGKTRLLTTLLEHEFGHLMGLVGQGSPMQSEHRDPAAGAHCNNINCLMHQEVETLYPGSSSLFRIPMLDSNCIADLKANGG